MAKQSLLDEFELRLAWSKFKQYRPYGHPDTLCPDGKLFKKLHWEEWSNKPWQLDFHNAGADCKERLVIAANGVGKSLANCWELSAHLTGMYPKWYEGYRFEEPIIAWAGAIDAGLQVEGIQKILLGADLSHSLGTGFIPKHVIVGKASTRQSGIPNTCHTINIKHTSGGISQLIFKTYKQGWKAWQTAAPNVILVDEQPDDNDVSQKPIFEECQTRIFRSGGLFMGGMTPLLGETELTRHFMNPKADGIYYATATWDDVGHLKKEDKERLRKTYPAHSMETRTLGVPMMGEGRIFTAKEDEILCNPFDIPDHWIRIAGIDFGAGVGHPTAGAWLAWDRQSDVIYLYDEYRKEQEDSVYHAEAFRKRGTWIPISWPHDGHKTSDITKDKSKGQTIADKYRIEHRLNMLPISARYDRKTGGAQDQWPIIETLDERMKTGRFRVFRNLPLFLEEMRSFHQKNGKIVNRREDLIKAVMYATMMINYGIPKMRANPKPQASTFVGLR